uniref:CCHC-type domain-containing protein n=1 Tax=Tanacetum cinerariifolium TaxID=118510 RepID=A0A6L2MPV5_TANCI|nr:hypothetical protein [Tanacetum cinerariifolium]
MANENVPAPALIRSDDQILSFAEWAQISSSTNALGKHNLHQRSKSPFHLVEEDLRLRYLQFVTKGEDNEVFGMKIPNELIIGDIRRAPYYKGYLEMVAKHERKVAAKKEGGTEAKQLSTLLNQFMIKNLLWLMMIKTRQRKKEIDKLMALISLLFKKIYKPTNNNLHTSSNTSRANQDNSLRIQRNTGYEGQRSGTVAGARDTVGSSMVQKSRIQCYNCKEYEHDARECHKPKRAKDAAYHREKMETIGSSVVQKSGIQCYNCKVYGHVARECQKPKRAKDAAYHTEKMLLCKQEEAGIQSQQAATRNRGKAIVNSPQPIYDQAPSMVDDDDETSKDKEIDKLMALISLSFKKIYKPTNNNLRTSSNTSRANQDNSLRIYRNDGYEHQRLGNVAGARETVGSTVVQKSRIQCYNYKEYGHVARECQKPKKAKDAAYHREKMLLCKQEEARIQLNAEQADWKDDTDDESDDQELKAHYMYMAKLQQVSLDAVDSGPIFDKEPEQKIQHDDHYDVFSIESQHPEQSKSVYKTYLIEQDARNMKKIPLEMILKSHEKLLLRVKEFRRWKFQCSLLEILLSLKHQNTHRKNCEINLPNLSLKFLKLVKPLDLKIFPFHLN